MEQQYFDFVEKFKPKKTTDDCYTPPVIYDAVADWVAQRYGVDRAAFCRPFYPGGNFEGEDYTGKIVVDNPPFSIMARILRFYNEHEVRFFLFAPSLTLFSGATSDACTYLPTGCDVTYENGATVRTSFVTNLGDRSVLIDSAPELFQAVKEANDQVRKENKKELPRYSYPPNVLTATMVHPYSRLGIAFQVPRKEAAFVRALDDQRDKGASLFGGGFLLSDRLAAERERAERERAERERAERWQLSYREKQIIKLLDKRAGNEKGANET